MSNQLNLNIYVDNQNVKLTLEFANLLQIYAKMQGTLERANIYDVWPEDCQSDSHKTLANLGFKCISVISPLKDCADYQLVFDCIGALGGNPSPNAIVLVSGDGDFQPLVSHLTKIGIRAIVFARRGNVKKTLIDSADKFHFLDELPQLIGSLHKYKYSDKLNDIPEIEPSLSETNTTKVGGKTKKTKKNTKKYLTYQEGISCLIQAIKTALKQGKPTLFNNLDALMRKNPNFPNYKGASSIAKPEGDRFRKFGKFIESAVKDGKVGLKPKCKIPEVVLIGL